jgi:hypothetical protein
VTVNQGDQIGPIFDQWVIVYFGQFYIYENDRSSPHFLFYIVIFTVTFMHKFLQKCIGLHFPNSSGHPAVNAKARLRFYDNKILYFIFRIIFLCRTLFYYTQGSHIEKLVQGSCDFYFMQ